MRLKNSKKAEIFLEGAMFVHVGYETCVQSEAILAILTKESALASKETRSILKCAKERGAYDESAEGVRSYVFLNEAGSLRVVKSALRAKTLFERVCASGFTLN